MAYRKTRKPSHAGSGEGSHSKIYDLVTDKIIAELEAGTVPWQQPWAMTNGLPLRMNGSKPYRGVNIFLLQMTAMARGYTSPWWGTYDHIAELSGMAKVTDTSRRGYHWESPDGTPRGVRKDEKSTLVIFWKRTKREETDPATGEKTTRTGMMLRYYIVFNAQQADHLPAKYTATTEPPADTPDPVEAAEKIIATYLEREGLELSHANPGQAYYDVATDDLNSPPLAAFTDPNEYYSTVLHELGHSTGHPKRLARYAPGDPGCQLGSPDYSREELVAEMTDAMVCAVAGTDTPEVTRNSAAYIAGWIKRLRGDPKLAVLAAAKAQKAADRILGVSWADEDEPVNGEHAAA